MKPKLFIDFDETLFNHMAMLTWLDGIWQTYYGSKPDIFRKTIDQYHQKIDDVHRLYKHREHYALSGKPWEEVSVHMSQLIAEQGIDFCYPEVHQILERLDKQGWEPSILTFGDKEYQLYKISHCKVLTKLNWPVIVVNEPKRTFLARKYGGVVGILVDDKYPLHLPHGWHHIWINRYTNNSRQQRSKRVTCIKSLLELPAQLNSY